MADKKEQSVVTINTKPIIFSNGSFDRHNYEYMFIPDEKRPGSFKVFLNNELASVMEFKGETATELKTSFQKFVDMTEDMRWIETLNKANDHALYEASKISYSREFDEAEAEIINHLNKTAKWKKAGDVLFVIGLVLWVMLLVASLVMRFLI